MAKVKQQPNLSSCPHCLIFIASFTIFETKFIFWMEKVTSVLRDVASGTETVEEHILVVERPIGIDDMQDNIRTMETAETWTDKPSTENSCVRDKMSVGETRIDEPPVAARETDDDDVLATEMIGEWIDNISIADSHTQDTSIETRMKGLSISARDTRDNLAAVSDIYIGVRFSGHLPLYLMC